MPSSFDNIQYIFELLVENNIVNDAQVQKAKELVSKNQGKISIIDALKQLKYIDDQKIISVLADAYGLETIDLSNFQLSKPVQELLSSQIVKQYNVLPVKKVQDTITVAMSDPGDIDTIDSLRYLLNCNVEAVIAPKSQIEQLISRYYGSLEENVHSLLVDIDKEEVESVFLDNTEEHEGSSDDAPIIRLVSHIVLEAYKKNASDIHLEPLAKKFRIRYRVDGVLVEVEGPPRYLQANIISRLKIMANLDITEKRLPQDGRIRIKLKGKELDLRVSTVPTSHGESIVMRILDKSNVLLDISTLGFLEDDVEMINKIISMPDGIFLVTGPTGSGKTTSLYSFLNTMNEASKKIITVEDPIEYHIEGINQVQVQTNIGMTFAAALRSMMRQSPNIIMVGEIRDAETAEIAINAALTGHLVFSTLHTNDAPGAVTRLIDIGINPFLVSSSVNAIMAQRLIRKVCKNCARPYTPNEEELKFLNLPKDYFDKGKLLKGEGCAECSNTGYRGRTGIYEIFRMTEEIQHLIFKKASRFEIREHARKAGMRTLREDGLRKVMAGFTTIDEVVRITIADLA